MNRRGIRSNLASAHMSRGAFYVLFTASGFAGLIYESIWTHYLKLYLGHAAYAQSLVLAVFMGGMAAGALLCGRFSARLASPLRAYALAEAAIGAAALNLAIAAAVWLLSRPLLASPLERTAEGDGVARLLLAAACLTGLASFIYEIVWIRMLSLVLGASTHSFELMLATFIFGLALGGLAVRRRIDAAAEPVRLLAWVQIAMGLAAAATLPVYDATFSLMEALMHALARTEGGYLLFNISGAGLAALVMLPATFFAGM